MDSVDLSSAETAEEAAKTLYEHLVDENPECAGEILLMDPEEAANKRNGHDCWTVCWEGGPFRWGPNVSMGGSMYNIDGEQMAKGILSNSNWIAEPYYKFDLQFSDN
jgi:hypothetical protein